MKYKKGLLCLTAVLILMSFSGCSSQWFVKEGDMTISKGLYIYYVQNAYNQAYAINKEPAKQALLESQVEGVDAVDWIKDRATAMSKRYMVIEHKFEEEGLSLSGSEIADVEKEFTDNWHYNGFKTYYLKIGIAEEDYRNVLTNDKKADKLIELYKDMLESQITQSDIKARLQEEYVSFQYISLGYKDTAGNDNKGLYDDIRRRLEAGEGMGALIDEYKELPEDKNIYTSAGSDTNEVRTTGKDPSYPKEFRERLFEAKAGEIIYYEDTINYTYNVAQKTDILGNAVHLDKESDTIQAALQEEKFDEMMSALFDGYSFKVNNKKIEELDVSSLV